MPAFRAIETRIGTVRFLAAYLCFAGLANLAQAGWMLAATPELASMPILGSSGAVAGVDSAVGGAGRRRCGGFRRCLGLPSRRGSIAGMDAARAAVFQAGASDANVVASSISATSMRSADVAERASIGLAGIMRRVSATDGGTHEPGRRSPRSGTG